MNNRVPTSYPPLPQEVKDYLRVIEEVMVPQCIEGETVSILTSKSGSALKPSYATMDGKFFFSIYYSKGDVWEDAYYDVWYSSEDKSERNENLLIDLAIESIKSLEYWEK